MKRQSIRMDVHLSPDDPRDLEIIKFLSDVAPRRRVVKMKHLAYEGIMAGKQPRTQVQVAQTSQPRPEQVPPVREAPPVKKPVAATSIPQQAPEEYVPEYGDASEFLEILRVQAERFTTQSWDGK